MQEKLIARINLKREERLSPDLLGLEVQISVKDSKGSPVQNTTFNLQLDGQDVVKGITDQDGNFEGEKVVNLKESVRKEIELKLAGTGETLARLLLSQKEIRAERERIEEEKKQEEARLEKERQETAQREEEEKRREAEESKRIAGEQEKVRRAAIECYKERVNKKIEDLGREAKIIDFKKDLAFQVEPGEVNQAWRRILASLMQKNPLNNQPYVTALTHMSAVHVAQCPTLSPKSDDYWFYLMNLDSYALKIYSSGLVYEEGYSKTRSTLAAKGFRLPSTEEAERVLKYSPHQVNFKWFADNEVYIDSKRAWVESGINPSKAQAVKCKTSSHRERPNCTCFPDMHHYEIYASTSTDVQGIGILNIPLIDPKNVFLNVLEGSYGELPYSRPNWEKIHSYFAQVNPANGKSYAETLEDFDLNEKGRVEMWIEDGVLKVATSREDQKQVLCVPMW